MENTLQMGQRSAPKNAASAARRKRFRVFAESSDRPFVDVYAYDKADALKLAGTIDGGFFQPSKWADCSWEIASAIEIPDGQPFDPIDGSRLGTL